MNKRYDLLKFVSLVGLRVHLQNTLGVLNMSAQSAFLSSDKKSTSPLGVRTKTENSRNVLVVVMIA